ncbi:MAG TPA: PqqD family protein [Rhizomicrobium sp.]|nr:PqqD family protein [Rhizomicrobium sp.]
MTADRAAVEAALVSGARIGRAGDWLSAEIGDELVMMSTASGRYVGLSDTGRRIWELLDAPLTFAALCAALAAEFEVTAAEVAPDVTDFIAELVALGAIALDPPAG